MRFIRKNFEQWMCGDFPKDKVLGEEARETGKYALGNPLVFTRLSVKSEPKIKGKQLI